MGSNFEEYSNKCENKDLTLEETWTTGNEVYSDPRFCEEEPEENTL